jgi:hypothetical protein
MRKMYASEALSTLSPRTLQQKVFFEVMLFFCNMGRENLRNMKPSDYEIRTDSEGRRYVGSRISRLSKNHRENDHDTTAARMYQKPGMSSIYLKSHSPLGPFGLVLFICYYEFF